MNYETQSVQLEGNGMSIVYFVREKTTDQYIDWSLTKTIIDEQVSFLNSGGAFDGWTPSFMLVEGTASTDIDEDFEKLVGEL